MQRKHGFVTTAISMGLLLVCGAYAEVQIAGVQPTIYFPNPAEGEPFSQKATLTVGGVDPSVKFHARVTVPGKAPCLTAVTNWTARALKKKV